MRFIPPPHPQSRIISESHCSQLRYLHSRPIRDGAPTHAEKCTISLPGPRPLPGRPCQMLFPSTCASRKTAGHLERALILSSDLPALLPPSCPPSQPSLSPVNNPYKHQRAFRPTLLSSSLTGLRRVAITIISHLTDGNTEANTETSLAQSDTKSKQALG